MRYYDIKVSDENGKLLPDFCFSSLLNGVFNPNCLMVELDIQKYGLSTPMGACLIRIYGLSPKSMQQANQNLVGKNITVEVGMTPGLPLATAQYKAKQYGVVLIGSIWQAFGNWQGTDLSLDIIVYAGPVVSPSKPTGPLNVTLPWPAGTKLAIALTKCFQTGFPSYTHNINISDDLVRNHDSGTYVGNLESLASYLKITSKSIIRDENYSGVEMAIVGNEIRVWDSVGQPVSQSTPKQLIFTDLIGQPTWIRPQTVCVTLVMRADINVGDYIKMPVNSGKITITQSASIPSYREQSAFFGVFMVTSVRIVGNSRQPDGNGWITIIEAITT